MPCEEYARFMGRYLGRRVCQLRLQSGPFLAARLVSFVSLDTGLHGTVTETVISAAPVWRCGVVR